MTDDILTMVPISELRARKKKDANQQTFSTGSKRVYFFTRNESQVFDRLLAEWNDAHHDGWSLYHRDPNNIWIRVDDHELAARLHAWQSESLMWVRGPEDDEAKPFILSVSKQRAIVKHALHAAPRIDWSETTPGVAFSDGSFAEVDGKTIRWRRVKPSDRVRHALTVGYAPDAPCDRWTQFLEQVWGHMPDYKLRVAFLQEWFGTLLARLSTRYQKAIILTGAGDNGKSRILDPLLELIPYDVRKSIALSEMHESSFQLSGLEGAWLNVVGDMSRQDLKYTGPLKQAIDGTPINAKKKYRTSRQFTPTAGHIVSCNELPVSHDVTHGFWRRLGVLTFERQWPEGHPDRDELLPQKLQAEAEGIAAWAMKGLVRLLERGDYAEPPSSVEAKDEWRASSDSVSDFVANELVKNFSEACSERTEEYYREAKIRFTSTVPKISKKGTPTKVLWKAHSEWADDVGRRPVSLDTFAVRLNALGYPRRRLRDDDVDGRQYRRRLWLPETDHQEADPGW